jgi:hypothetical protein
MKKGFKFNESRFIDFFTENDDIMRKNLYTMYPKPSTVQSQFTRMTGKRLERLHNTIHELYCVPFSKNIPSQFEQAISRLAKLIVKAHKVGIVFFDFSFVESKEIELHQGYSMLSHAVKIYLQHLGYSCKFIFFGEERKFNSILDGNKSIEMPLKHQTFDELKSKMFDKFYAEKIIKHYQIKSL